MAASARMEFRIRPDVKGRIEHAAELVRESSSDFARSAAEARAEQILSEHQRVTMVQADYFDRMLAALDEPAQPNAALARAATRARNVIKRQP